MTLVFVFIGVVFGGALGMRYWWLKKDPSVVQSKKNEKDSV